MERKIIAYHLDEEGDWVADLDCCHGQHVRHKPPFTNRPWTQTEAGRADMLGTTLHCVRCDQLEWPDNVTSYSRTREFTAENFPAALARDHATKVGVWGKIHVLEGALVYILQEPERQEFRVLSGEQAVVVPTMLHHVKPVGSVRFFVEFFRREDSA